MYHLRIPTTEAEFNAYYQFRWEMLRKPFNHPLGSEKDGYDLTAHHQMVVDEKIIFWLLVVFILMLIMRDLFVFSLCIPACRGRGLVN